MEEKKTRRNKRILIISAMLVLLIALLCFGGTTFAKYITSKEVTVDQATVAKWGFVVKADTTNMFGDKYVQKTQNSLAEIAARDDESSVGIDVFADTKGNKIVAPGTTGNMTFQIDGTAEVLAKVSASIDTTATKLKAISLDTYEPIVWTLYVKEGDDEFAVAQNKGATDSDPKVDVTGNLAAFATKFNTYFADNAAPINPGDSIVNTVYKIEWKWEFSTTKGDSDNYDIEDTLLGYAANGGWKQDADKNTVGDWVVDGTTLKKIASVPDTGDPTYDTTTHTFNINLLFNLTVSVEQVQSK